MSSDLLLEITSAWATGKSAKALEPQVKKLLESLDNEALVEVFKVLPRPLSMPHFQAFRKAEEALKDDANAVATLLVSTNFEDCGPVESIPEIISYAVARVDDDVMDPHAEAVFEWRKRLCVLAPKSAAVDLDAHARNAMIYAINAPNFLFFEDVHDAVSGVKLTSKESQLLLQFIDTVLLTGSGSAGYEAFLAKAGKDFFAGLKVQGALRKTQLLSLCTLLAGKKDVAMSEVAKGLGVGAEDAERLVVDAALANVIDVEVDRSNGIVRVKSVMPLRFDAKALKHLLDVLDENIALTEKLRQSYA